MYINDLQGGFSKLIVHHFADDTNLLFPAKKLGTIESVVNHELKLISQWLRSNNPVWRLLNVLYTFSLRPVSTGNISK